MPSTPEQEALTILEPMASENVLEAAKRVVSEGTHAWRRDSLGTLGLIKVSDPSQASIVVYPGPTADFEVDDEWLEGWDKYFDAYRRLP